MLEVTGGYSSPFCVYLLLTTCLAPNPYDKSGINSNDQGMALLSLHESEVVMSDRVCSFQKDQQPWPEKKADTCKGRWDGELDTNLQSCKG